MGDVLRRSAWIFLAGIFVISSVGIVIASFVFQDNSGDKITQEENVTKLAGTKLVGFTPVEDVPQLQKIDQTVGSGAEAKAESTLTVHYTGALAATGEIFESSLDSGQPAQFPLNGVIQGWQQGVPGMKEGGTRRLLIPAELAYGGQASAKIPANSDLVFDITLIKVE
jgi:FKBP-type peptidyl-prolyl cis-trans isomerase